MTVLVTGGTGFLGSFIARHICDSGGNPVLMDTHPSLWRLRGYEDRVVVEQGSVTSWADLVDAVRRHDVTAIVHTAADLSLRAEKSRVESFRTNVEATLNVLEIARMFDIQRVVFTSSLSVLGRRSVPVAETSFRDPSTFYGSTKACSEILGSYYSKAHGIEFAAVRFPTIVGPYRRGEGAMVAVSSFIDEVVTSGKSTVTLPPEAAVPLLYVKDAVRLVHLMLESERRLRDIYVVGGVVLSVGELVEAVKRAVPGAEIDYRIDDASRRIAEEWVELTEMAVKSGLIERFRRIDDFNWSIEFDSVEKMVSDHVATLRREVSV
ncbi:NAD-dependent epimerase/dehydratase family protein [Geoglobus sp.]